MYAIRPETPADRLDRERLLDVCFGPNRRLKTSERMREGRVAADGLAFTLTRDGTLCGTLRLWDVEAGPGRPALWLGPLAVDPRLQGCGLGSRLLRHGLADAADLGHAAVLLVGDAPYYARFGFGPAAVGRLALPGPCEVGRFLGLALVPGALAGAAGLVRPTGALATGPDRLRRGMIADAA